MRSKTLYWVYTACCINPSWAFGKIMSHMSTDKDFIVHFSRKKIIGMISNLVFVIAVFLFLYLLNRKSDDFFVVFQEFVTPIIIIFMTILLVNNIRSLRSRLPAFIINSQGIVDNSSSTSVGLILWKEITKIYVTKISSERLITIEVKNPEKIFLQGNPFKRIVCKGIFLISKSSIHISANSLDIGFDELKEKVGDFYGKYGRV